MIARRRRSEAWLWSLTLGVFWSSVVLGQEAKPDAKPAHRALAPAAPGVPGSVVAALQEKKYDAAATALGRLAAQAKGASDKAYFLFVKGVAERLGGKVADARKTLNEGLAADPKGPWVAKLRFELATLELGAGKPAAAEALARVEAEGLLAGDRKDRLAEVYHAFARRLLSPDDPVTPANPAEAFQLLNLARDMAKSEALRARLLLAMGEALQKANQHPQAVAAFESYLKEYPKGADRPTARFHLGEAQFASGQGLPARLTWSDLARDLEKDAAGDPKLAEIRAESLYRIALTHGIPNPPDDTQLNLGVAALQRYLAAYPSHNDAVRAAYQIGQSYLVRGKSDQAIAAFTAFLKGEGFKAESDSTKRDLDELSRTATYQIGAIYQGQEKFNEAIAAYKGYLAKYPNGSQSADAQRAILDTQLAIANDALRREQYGEARKGWTEFVAQNPLDPRVPQLLFQVGESFQTQGQYDQAIAAWDTLLSKFPGSEPASHAQFQIASIYEEQKGDPAGAIERFRKVAAEPWRSQALGRVAVMESRVLTVVTPRAFRSGETAQLRVTTRNLETLTFTAYKLNAESYFRKKHDVGNVEALDIGLVAPDAEWTVPVPGYAKYKPVESSYDLKVKVPGVYVVKVTDEKHLQATTLVLGSDVDAIVKVSREQLLVFAQDMKTGKGRPNARVLVSDGTSIILEKTTGADGVLLTAWEQPRDPGAGLHYLVLDGESVAGSGLNIPGKVAQGLAAKAYIYTDRPAYRPGSQVSLRGVVRETSEGQYSNPAGQTYKLEVYDSRGRLLLSKPQTLSAFGTFAENLTLDESAPVGGYRVRLYQPGKSDFSGAFEVQSYRLEKVDVSIDLPKTVYFRGETIKGDVIGKYQYGAPLAGRPIQVVLPDGRILNGTTSAEGKFPIEFKTEGFAEEQQLQIVARMPQDGVAAAASVTLAIRAFSISLNTTRDVYLDGESFQLNLTTNDAQGKPTGQELKAAVIKKVNVNGRISERQVQEKVVTTDPKTGEASVSLAVNDDRGGDYIVRVSGKDRFGNPVFSDRNLLISGKDDPDQIRLLADRQTFKVGETASVKLHAKGKGGTALLAWEGDRVLTYKIVTLAPGDTPLTWAVDGAQFPNFTLTASQMAGTEFHEARLDVRVERDLRVTLTPKKEAVGPGEDVEVEVTTVDQLGKPVAAEVSLALVDQALLRLYGDNLPPIGPYFYNQTRTGAFETEATNTFSYQPGTTPVAEALVEEAERAAAQLANDARRAGARTQAGQAVVSADRFDGPAAAKPALALPAPAAMGAPMAPTASGEMMGGMGGGMGGMGGGAPMDAARLKMYSNSDFAMSRSEDGEQLAKRDASGLANAPAKELRAVRRGRVMSKDKAEFDGKNASPSRERFVETAYWNPRVVTGADGKTTVTFKAPGALSEYRFSARGVTGADTLVGQTTAGLSVRKPFFVDLRTPARLTEGDKPRYLAQVHHVGIKGKVDLTLTVYAGNQTSTYPRTIELKGDGVEEVLFEPIAVPQGDSVRLTLTAKSGETTDELISEVPVRPWGIEAVASASGTSSNDATVFVGLPAGRAYENPEMRIVLAPTLRRLLIELAVGRDPVILYRSIMPPPETQTDRAGELIAATSALQYLRAVGASSAPEATRLADRIQGLVSELITSQNDDGGWPWINPGVNQPKRPSETMASARAAWALASAEPLGLLPDAAPLDRAAAFLTQQFARTDNNDHDARTMIVHALSTRGKATFEQANMLNRFRNGMSDTALAYLALTFANLDRITLANEVVGILAPRGRTEAAGPNLPPRKYWNGSASSRRHGGPAETTALVAYAYARVRPQDRDLDAAANWLLAHRVGNGWQPHHAKGPALAALGAYYAKAEAAEDRYRLTVRVNDQVVHTADIAGPSEGKAVAVPNKVLQLGAQNKVSFDIEGRGTFGYAVVLTGFTRDFGPEQNRQGKPFLITDRKYLAVEPELDGKPLPVGFSTVINAQGFENKVTQVALGGRTRIQVDGTRYTQGNQPQWDQDFLVIEETLPAGTTLIDGSVKTGADSWSVQDNVLSLYFSPGNWPGTTSYEVFGYLPGDYRSLPARIRSVYEPGRVHLGPTGDLKVLSPGEKGTDPYKATPDELYTRGRIHHDAGRFAEASEPLEELFGGYTLRDDIAREAARMLLNIHIKEYNARKVVQYFEVLKEKSPDLVIPFDEVLVVGRAYRDINEHERAFLVWRAIVEASYLEDARVGETLRQRGRTLDAIAYLVDLWREYPNTASIESDFFGLSQLLAGAAGRAISDPALRKELAETGVTRSDLLLQTIKMIQVLLAQSPQNPIADEASLALVGAFLELEDFPSVVALSARYAKLFPKSTFLDSFQYSEALGRFQLGEYDRAIEVAEAIANATYKDANGVDQPSPNKWQALYILGQIYDARRQPAKAVEYYKQVAERFTDAAGAVKAMTRKDLKLPEVTIVRPGGAAGGKGVSAEDLASGNAFGKDRVVLDYRNIADTDVKVYPVDLMRLYLTRRNLDGIAGIDLAGITPKVETPVKLGDGEDYDDKKKVLELGLKEDGAYLVMIRGGDLYASGIALVTPLELEVQEEPEAGRVRVVVRDAKTKAYVPKVQVKVIGTENPTFLSGQTDLRGVYVAEGVRGQVTAVARKGSNQYAFYRGTSRVGAPPTPAVPPVPGGKPGDPAPAQVQQGQQEQGLDANLKSLNMDNQNRQINRLQNRYNDIRKGIRTQEAR